MSAVTLLQKQFVLDEDANFVSQNVRYLLATGAERVRIAVVERGDEETIYTVRADGRAFRYRSDEFTERRRVRFTGCAEPKIDGVRSDFTRRNRVGNWIIIAAGY